MERLGDMVTIISSNEGDLGVCTELNSGLEGTGMRAAMGGILGVRGKASDLANVQGARLDEKDVSTVDHPRTRIWRQGVGDRVVGVQPPPMMEPNRRQIHSPSDSK